MHFANIRNQISEAAYAKDVCISLCVHLKILALTKNSAWGIVFIVGTE